MKESIFSRWLEQRNIGLIRRLEISTWLAVAVMIMLSITLIAVGSWMTAAYDRQRLVAHEYVNLTDLARGIASYREGMRLLEIGEEKQATESIASGNRLVHSQLDNLENLQSIPGSKVIPIRQELMTIESAEQHILGIKAYLDNNRHDLSDAEYARKRAVMVNFIHLLEKQSKNIDFYLLSLRREIAEVLEIAQLEVKRLTTMAGTIGLLCVILVACFSIWLLTHSTRRLTSVFSQLRKVFNRMAVGDYAIRLPVSQSRDIGFLFDGFNEMIERLEENRHERVKYAQRLEMIAYRDALTGLYNRTMLRRHLDVLRKDRRHQERNQAVMFLDIDRFKGINDSLGHQVGDGLIQGFADRIKGVLRDADVIARLGGDEFAIILHDIEVPAGVEEIAQRILDELKIPFEVGNFAIHVTTSIGISLFPDDDTSYDELLRKADLAMYQAKENGRNGYAFYCDELNRLANDRLRLEADLRVAIENDKFTLDYQPKFNTHSGHIVGAEALLRWNHPREGRIPPDLFVPILEESGMIDVVGRWAIREACRWSAQRGGFNIAVNVATRQLYDDSFASFVGEALKESGIEACSLELEITESLLMENTDAVKSNLASLRAQGIHLAIDDFGTGYSSLSYLQRYPVDVLKLDRSFIAGIEEVGAAVIAGVVAMAHGLNMQVVAEGVESKDQLVVLRTLGCDCLQGFLISQPLSADKFDQFADDYSPDRNLFLEQDSFDEIWRSRKRRQMS